MNRTEFPLEVLLRQRQRVEEERQLELAVIQRRLDEEQEVLDSFQERRALALAHLNSEQASPKLDLGAIDRCLAHINWLRTAITAQRQVVFDLGNQLERTREGLLQASRDVKIVDKLKETWLAEQRQERLRREAKVAAEAAIGQFNRRLSAL